MHPMHRNSYSLLVCRGKGWDSRRPWGDRGEREEKEAVAVSERGEKRSSRDYTALGKKEKKKRRRRGGKEE